MKQHEHAEVLRAIADGKDVQFKYAEHDANWLDVFGISPNPIEDAHLVWRVKPEATV